MEFLLEEREAGSNCPWSWESWSREVESQVREGEERLAAREGGQSVPEERLNPEK